MGTTLHLVAGSILFLVTAIAPETALALDWNVKIASHDDRFYIPPGGGPNPDFIGDGFDWSGVGITQPISASDTWSQGHWVTMISDKYFLSAYHVGLQGSSVPVDFYPTNDIAVVETATIDPSFGQRIAGTDLWLGRLMIPPSAAIARYPIIKRPDSTYYPSYLDSKIYMVGYADGFSDYNFFRLGTNNISGMSTIQQDVFGTSGVTITSVKDANAGYDEVDYSLGDSSGPTFVKSPVGGLAITGIHWTGSRDTNVSHYASQIVSNDPEPVTIMTDLAGDLNADFQVTNADVATLSANLGHGPGFKYSQGDITGDGSVTSADLAALSANLGEKILAPSDFNQDFVVDATDFTSMASHWHQTVTAHTNGDANGDRYVDSSDLSIINQNYVYPKTFPSSFPIAITGDFNQDGVTDPNDESILSSHFGQTVSPGTDGDLTHDGHVTNADVAAFASLILPTYAVDANGDHTVGPADATIVFGHWHQWLSGAANGDFNLDNYIDETDLALLVSYWGVNSMTSQENGGVAVPECSALMYGIFGLAITAQMRVRRH